MGRFENGRVATSSWPEFLQRKFYPRCHSRQLNFHRVWRNLFLSKAHRNQNWPIDHLVMLSGNKKSGTVVAYLTMKARNRFSQRQLSENQSPFLISFFGSQMAKTTSFQRSAQTAVNTRRWLNTRLTFSSPQLKPSSVLINQKVKS